jgi:hypothetical protein
MNENYYTLKNEDYVIIGYYPNQEEAERSIDDFRGYYDLPTKWYICEEVLVKTVTIPGKVENK